MILSSLLAAALLVAAERTALETVSIELSARKSTILVGEPLRCTAIWRATEETGVMPHRAHVMIDRGTGYEEWRERREGSEAGIPGGAMVRPDRPAASTHIIAVGRTAVVGRPGAAILAFPEPGSYRVRIEYRIEGTVLTSNSVNVLVLAPGDEDRDIFTRYVRVAPDALSIKAWEYRTFLAPAFEESNSVYLAWPHVNVMRYRILSAIKEAPDGYPVQGEVPALLTALAERDFGDSPFDEDRLELLAQMQDRTGRKPEAIATFQRLVERYPNGQAAMRAQVRLEQLLRKRSSTEKLPLPAR